MPKVFAFSGSNSSTSINHRLILAVKEMMDCELEILKLTDFEVPMYGIDHEKNLGIPDDVLKLKQLFSTADAFIISTPEHNGNLPAFFKNILDWLSRVEGKSMEGKPTLLLSTSPGRGGASKALALLEKVIPYEGAVVKATFALPSFHENFNTLENKISNNALNNNLKSLLNKLL